MRIFLLLEPKYLGGLANIGGVVPPPPGPNVEPPLLAKLFVLYLVELKRDVLRGSLFDV